MDVKSVFKRVNKLNEEDDYIDQKNSMQHSDDDSGEKDDAYYFSIRNPETGKRYDIPMIDPISATYFYDYVYYMKVKERNPELFQKIISWE